MKIKNTLRAGFTLVEIMIVVAIIGLLAAIAIPNFVKARNTAQRNTCINNLRMIDGAKQQWALESNAGDTEEPTIEQVKVYIKNERMPACPSKGNYKINVLTTDPTCSINGHRLDPI